ncbi:MAG: hypothetical protein IPM54_17095 [Polyangiaceae bacterium]|nr:hypothetical protein [Polyangiaceae bacterium]
MARATLSVVATAATVGAVGCLDRPIDTIEPRLTVTIVEKLQQSSVDKIDLVLGIDNSRSMADKQQILALAIPDLVKGLVNPRCLDDNGVPAQMQPAYPTEACPAGTKREFEPVLDIHIGVTSSSIGGHGADSCPNIDNGAKECQPNPNTTNNDKGQLLARLDQCGGQEAPTYQNKKFLAWDPGCTLNPPACKHNPGGETVIDDGMGGGIVPTLRDMVVGTGQIGCGYESQLESIYRFLADPEPYETITAENFKAVPQGTDMVLLQQRAEFMRPDSLLAIIMLTDENDCSIKEFGQFYYVGQLRNGATPVRLPRARQECAKDPNDPCCKSCGQPAGSCPEDPTCIDPNTGKPPTLLSDVEDNINLRCWDQKRRFGIDFLYPTDRYVQAFSSAKIPNRAGELVDNPIFSDLNPQDNNSNIRDSGLVFFAGIIGVPWQDIARDKTDLKKGFKDANELNEQIDASGITTWDVILGNPTKNVQPLDPLMVEAVQKRTGTNPITGDVLVDASMPNANPINGHEWTIPNDDLQYACIFPLLPGTDRDCTNTNLTACDCTLKDNDNPLCQADPNNMGQPTLQVRAKAYPGLRPLSVLRDLGSQGIVASVCPAQLSNQDENATDFGYRPAIGAIIDRLKTALGGQCLPRTLVPDSDGNVPCLIIEARNSQGQCACDPGKARLDIPSDSEKYKAVEVAKQDALAAKAGWDCFCEIAQTEGGQRDACQNTNTNPLTDAQGQPVNGWCYVDATTEPPTGNAEIVAKCPDNERRIIRFVGEGEAQTGATLFITCSGDSGG